MKFKTPFEYGDSSVFKTEIGEFQRPTYTSVLGKNGQIELKEDGVELTYEKIQSYKESVDINLIVKRYAAGDMLALEQAEGVYGDFIQVPSSYMEVLNSIVEARSAYEESGMDISFEEFVDKALNPVSEAVEPIKEEVVTDEQKSE